MIHETLRRNPYSTPPSPRAMAMDVGSLTASVEAATAPPRCTLLGGTFAMLVQVGLMVSAIATLAYKRSTETPRRPVRCSGTLAPNPTRHSPRALLTVARSGPFGSLTPRSRDLLAFSSTLSTSPLASSLHDRAAQASARGTWSTSPSPSHAAWYSCGGS